MTIEAAIEGSTVRHLCDGDRGRQRHEHPDEN
jgi:hypothetical protein